MQQSRPSYELADVNQSDVTGTVNLSNPEAVTDAVCAILGRRYRHFEEDVLRQGFVDIEDAFWGRYPGLLCCDTPYHDLRHSLGTTLLMARMVDGYEVSRGVDEPAIGSAEAVLVVLLALFHDIGFLRRESEAQIDGACLIHDHEQRGVDFVRDYLSRGPLARFVDQAQLIHATNVAKPMSPFLSGLPPLDGMMARMLGTADLVSQIGGRYYLERCRNFLYREFVAAGVDKTVSPTGETIVLYASPEELLRKTPGFYEHLVKRRLEEDFDGVYRYVASHFGGDDPYARAMQRNLNYLAELIRRNDFSSLRRKPVALMPQPGSVLRPGLASPRSP